MFQTNNNKNQPSLTSFLFFIVNFEHIPHLFLVFLLLTLNKEMFVGLGNYLPKVVVAGLDSVMDFF